MVSLQISTGRDFALEFDRKLQYNSSSEPCLLWGGKRREVVNMQDYGMSGCGMSGYGSILRRKCRVHNTGAGKI